MAYSEDDTRVKLIDPVLHANGWDESRLLRNYPVTDDRYLVEGEEYRRLKTATKADYVLIQDNVIVGVVEAKADDEEPLKHLGQAQGYGKRLDVPFVYITNGKQIHLHDRRTLSTEEVKGYLEPEKMYAAYQEWKGLASKNRSALEMPLYLTGPKRPRAYQEVAIKNVVENIARGKEETLLTMATGTGKTYVAFQIIWKLLKSKTFSRVLFLTDRILLKDQAYAEFEPFGQARCKLEGGDFNKNRDIYFSTYQTLFTGDLYKQIPSDFFDLIVIDECHRSRYGDWGVILEHFSVAHHLGMTATPKREDNIDVYEYFGDPIFEYSLGQAIEDGYLVPYKVYRITTNLYKEGLNIAAAEEVVYDDEIEPDQMRDFYEPSEYERAVTIPEQIDLLAKKVIELLDKTNPYGKTIVFCVDMAHAQAVKDKLNQLKGKEEYAARVVAEDKDDLTLFRDKEHALPVVATTVDLLSTGVDIPHVQNIVFMRPIASRVLFKQIIGRGSRLSDGKGFFRIIDFTNATRLIDEWDIPAVDRGGSDGPPVEPAPPYDKLMSGAVTDDTTGDAVPGATVHVKCGRWSQDGITDSIGLFRMLGLPSNDEVSVVVEKSGYRRLSKRLAPLSSESETPYEFRLKLQKAQPRKVVVKGIEVTIAEEVEVEFDGIKLSYAEYRKFAHNKMGAVVHSTDELREIWLNPERREKLIADLEELRVNIKLIKAVDNLEDSDGFDVIAHIAFDAPMLTREDRVKHFMRLHTEDIDQYGSDVGEAIRDIMERYKYSGEDNLSAQVFMLPNMNAKKEAIQEKYPDGLFGFMSAIKQGVYSHLGI